MGPAITGIAHVELCVTDLDTSVDWYCKLLGAQDVFRGADETEHITACAIFEPRTHMVLAFTQHLPGDGGTFSPRRPGLDHLAFAVADVATLEAWATHLDTLGIPHSRIHEDANRATVITLQDPDQIALELYVRRPRP